MPIKHCKGITCSTAEGCAGTGAGVTLAAGLGRSDAPPMEPCLSSGCTFKRENG